MLKLVANSRNFFPSISSQSAIEKQWVVDGSPTHSTPVRIDGALQFVPLNTSSKEFKRLQQQVRNSDLNVFVKLIMIFFRSKIIVVPIKFQLVLNLTFWKELHGMKLIE